MLGRNKRRVKAWYCCSGGISTNRSVLNDDDDDGDNIETLVMSFTNFCDGIIVKRMIELAMRVLRENARSYVGDLHQWRKKNLDTIKTKMKTRRSETHWLWLLVKELQEANNKLTLKHNRLEKKFEVLLQQEEKSVVRIAILEGTVRRLERATGSSSVTGSTVTPAAKAASATTTAKRSAQTDLAPTFLKMARTDDVRQEPDPVTGNPFAHLAHVGTPPREPNPGFAAAWDNMAQNVKKPSKNKPPRTCRECGMSQASHVLLQNNTTGAMRQMNVRYFKYHDKSLYGTKTGTRKCGVTGKMC